MKVNPDILLFSPIVDYPSASRRAQFLSPLRTRSSLLAATIDVNLATTDGLRTSATQCLTASRVSECPTFLRAVPDCLPYKTSRSSRWTDHTLPGGELLPNTASPATTMTATTSSQD